MNFCSECNNMLYPKSDKDSQTLILACRICDHKEDAPSNCVYVNEIKHSVIERTHVSQDIASDPTLPRTKAAKCPSCGGREAAFFRSMTATTGMTLFYVCCSCGEKWTHK
ncbi:RNA polymerase II core subunit [Tieghemostelium lacteum]|uniref:DNA-directed RNA polymerase subunit n=1 Tax=Tieghemostelium lacteum TaxID=361077 RepID=A0A151ZHX0_TIELA|nr:RNA polymerase II core subunit [Tieghemostelium lacteum]|eukprot:KYQ93563.1 RNA polymerase II core subunit [Tieghemostelium lacteum]